MTRACDTAATDCSVGKHERNVSYRSQTRATCVCCSISSEISTR